MLQTKLQNIAVAAGVFRLIVVPFQVLFT